MSTSTPWGPATHSTRLTPGLVHYMTGNGCGGYHLTAKAIAKMPEPLRRASMGMVTPAGEGWFDGKTNWALVAMSFPEHFDRTAQLSASILVRDHHPEEWAIQTGLPVSEENSRELRRRAFKMLCMTRPVVVTAWGSWADHVPDGMVGVHARIGGRQGTDVVGSYWLIEQIEYRNPHRQYGEFAEFVIDPERHQRVDVVFGRYKSPSGTVARIREGLVKPTT